MTLLALAEQIRETLAATVEQVNEERRTGDRVTMTVTIGKQQFRITCEELAADRQEPAV